MIAKPDLLSYDNSQFSRRRRRDCIRKLIKIRIILLLVNSVECCIDMMLRTNKSLSTHTERKRAYFGREKDYEATDFCQAVRVFHTLHG